jgi:hypothetical protein
MIQLFVCVGALGGACWVVCVGNAIAALAALTGRKCKTEPKVSNGLTCDGISGGALRTARAP